MNKIRALVLAGSVVLGTALTDRPAYAGADTWSAYWNLTNLENDGDGIQVWGTGISPFPNPNGCTNANGIRPYTGGTAESREVMARMVLSMFLAGRKAKFHIIGNTCSAGYPVYKGVHLDDGV